MRKSRYPELKAQLKELAKEIKKWKRNRKEDKRMELGISLWHAQSKVEQYAWEFRHKHIAYCMLRGRAYEEIEQKCNTSPSWTYIDSVREEYEQKDICASA